MDKAQAGQMRTICCDCCPYNPTCEEYNEFLRDIGLASEWGEQCSAVDGCNDAAGSKVAQVRSGLDLPDQSQSNSEGQR